ncbi:hypothetical protein TNCV_4647061 [Trichonephila clavipes]|uniref:Uncharacterized protein n=1 Tax=Trichonephila clavipes TaxID=2585209 RepID=A0A8X6T648_TRICX|nr:hypothetical protein TNCV_4647061 [Trichonephila clavipes]
MKKRWEKKKNQRSRERRNHHQNQQHHRKRSKSGSRRRSSRSCSADRRRRSKSRTSELDLQRESQNRIDNANQDDIFGDSTPNQLRCDGYVGQNVNSGPNQRTRNKENNSDSYTPNQLCTSDTQMNNLLKGRFRKQKRHSNLIVCVDSTSEPEKESRMQKSFENQDVTSEGNVLNQDSTLGRRVNNVSNIAPLRSTRNKQIGSGMRRNNLSQGADSTPNHQSVSGMLRTNPGQNVSIDSVSNQQQSGTNISNSNQEVTVHNGFNLPCKDSQNDRNQCVDSVLNQLLGPDILNSNSNQSISIQSEPNQQRNLVSCMSSTNHTIDSLSNQEHRSETPKSVEHQFESLYSRDIQMLKSGTLMNISNQRVSDNSMSNEVGRSQTHDSNANIGISVDSISNQLHIPNIQENNLNQGVSVDPMPNRQSIFQIPGISVYPDVVDHPHGTGILEINNDHQIVPANPMVSNLNKGSAFDSASRDLNTLKNREKQSISIDCAPNEQYVCETSKNKGNPFLQNSDIMKELTGRHFNQSDSFDTTLNQQQRSGMLESIWNPDISVDSTKGSGSSKSHKDHCVIALDTTTGHGQFETIARNLNQLSSAYSFPNQPHGSGMVTNNTKQGTSIYSTPDQQSGSETWMSNLNRGTTVDPKPRQQGGPGIPKHRVVPVFCTGIHKLIDTEAMINASNKSPTDSSSKELRGVGTSKTNKKSDSTHDRRRGSKSRKSSFHREDSVDRSNKHRRSRKLKSSRNRVVSASKPNELRYSSKRPSAADESRRPGSQTSNSTRQVSISSTSYQERDCRNQVSTPDPEVISIDCVPNEKSKPRTGNSNENEDICVSYTSHLQRELEDEDVICLDRNPGQKSGSKSRSYRSDDRNGSVCCTCGQSKHSGSKCRICDVDKRRRPRSPLYHRHRRRFRSPYRDKRRGSRSRSSDHRHKRLGSRSPLV